MLFNVSFTNSSIIFKPLSHSRENHPGIRVLFDWIQCVKSTVILSIVSRHFHNFHNNYRQQRLCHFHYLQFIPPEILVHSTVLAWWLLWQSKWKSRQKKNGISSNSKLLDLPDYPLIPTGITDKFIQNILSIHSIYTFKWSIDYGNQPKMLTLCLNETKSYKHL